jgi:hypothetical protein
MRRFRRSEGYRTLASYRAVKLDTELDSELLVVSCKLLQHVSAFSIHFALVLHQGFKPDAAVRADAAKLDLAFVEKLD